MLKPAITEVIVVLLLGFYVAKVEFVRAISSFWMKKTPYILVFWTVIGRRVGYHGWTELCYVWVELD